jgi:AraC-like DNA-binding protein
MAYPDIILRTAAILALLTLAGLLLAARRRDHTPALGAFTALAVAAYIVTSARGADDWLGPAAVPLTALCVAKAALFWLFARGIFSDGFRVSGRHLAIVAATMAWGLWQQLVLMPRVLQGIASPLEQVAAGGFELSVVMLALFALNDAWRGLAADLLERRRRLRILVVTGVAGYLLAAVVVQTYNFVQGTVTPPVIVMANLAMITTAAVAALWHLVQLRAESWLEIETAAARPAERGALESRVLEALQFEIAERHVYREEGLTIGSLAARLRTREHVLRRVINQGLGYRNFNDFLHSFRIREACERLRRAEDARLPVLSIALDVGYGSIGPFNRAFKARMGMTPTQFRQPSGAAGAG